jgi:hypothetical protein
MPKTKVNKTTTKHAIAKSAPSHIIARSAPSHVIARSAATKQSIHEEKPLAPLLDGLPWQAFAIVADKADPSTWQLPHHTKAVKKAAAGKIGYEHTVDFGMLEACSLRLQRYGMNGEGRVIADPQLIIDAARHLAAHYRKAGQQIPTILCALV